MESKIVLLDTSVLIDYFRKTDKEHTLFVSLTYRFNESCISSVTEFEIYTGAQGKQIIFWENILSGLQVFSFDSAAAHAAVSIQDQLKKKRKTIDKADLFIAAIALSNNLPLATFNFKHFEYIDDLTLINTIS